jgi:hypothetical protein
MSSLMPPKARENFILSMFKDKWPNVEVNVELDNDEDRIYIFWIDGPSTMAVRYFIKSVKEFEHCFNQYHLVQCHQEHGELKRVAHLIVILKAVDDQTEFLKLATDCLAAREVVNFDEIVSTLSKFSEEVIK